MRKLLFITFLIVTFISCSEKEKEEEYFKVEGLTQGTTYTVIYSDSSGRNFSPEIEYMLSLIDQSVSTYKTNSTISKFNSLIDTSLWVDIDDIFFQNLILSKRIHFETKGAFDPTIAPLFSYFNFEENGLEIIDSLEVEHILSSSVGLDFIHFNIENKQIRKGKPSLTLNFNSIAQGFSVDFIAINLENKGVTDYMVEVGGEIRTKGKGPAGLDWKIGIDKPVDNSKPGDELQKVVELTGKSMATSGNYRKFYNIGSNRYSHTLNPKTGYPVDHNLLSVSVIAKTCAEADAYATAFMVMGLEESMKLIKSRKINVDAYFIISDENELFEFQSDNFPN